MNAARPNRARNTHSSDTGRRRARRLSARAGLGLLAAGLAVPLTVVPAQGLVTLTVPHAVEVFPGLDIVGVTGYDEPITVEVWRDGVKVGSSGEPQEPGHVVPDEDEIAQPMARMLEINHDGGACWAGHTPDIVAGDEIRVLTADGGQAGETMSVADISVEEPEILAMDGDGRWNDVVMTGRAVNPDGTPMDLALTEAEIVQPAFRDVGVPDWDRRVLIAATTGTPVANGTTTFGPDDTGTLVADPARPGYWVATWKNLPVPTADRPSFAELAMDGEHTFVMTEGPGTEETGGTGTTIAEPGDSSGPAQGCPPAITDGVTGTSPNHLNLATDPTVPLQIWGKSYNAASVTVTIDDTDTDRDDVVTVPARLSQAAATTDTSAPVDPVKQTWSAQVPMADVLENEDLAEGELIVSATYDRVVEQTGQRTVTGVDGVESTETVYTHPATPIGGNPHVMLKDLHAPAAPQFSLPGGSYPSAQWITVTPQDELQETARYRVGGPAVGAPTAGSMKADHQIHLSATQTVRAVSFDRAGNPSPVRTETYSIRAVAPPGQPGKPNAKPGDGQADVSWTAPADNGGSPITGYRIYVDAGSATPFEVRVDNVRTKTISGLTNGRTYRFRVAAINAGGEGPLSAASDPVTPSGAAGPGGPGTGPVDTTPPDIIRCKPAANEWNAPRSRNIGCRMSEPLRKGTVNGTTVKLTRTHSGRAVWARVVYRPAVRRVVINPRWTLDDRTRYTVTFTDGIRDRAGNRFAGATWKFRTGKRHW